ncbi:Uncharacterised protein [Mycobacteroides abscessus]|nr:Uncharacterised protein [Mycobacteroides abscessus]
MCGVAFRPWAAMVAYALVSSSGVTVASPSTFARFTPTSALMPRRAATSAVFSGPTSRLSSAYAVFTDCAVASVRSTFPQSWSLKLRTFQSSPLLAPGKVLGELPSKRSSSVCPFSRPAMSVNGLNVEPPCAAPRGALLYWFSRKFLPP